MSISVVRIARPVSDLARSRTLYCAGLDLAVIGSFAHHAGFSGVMLGKPGLAWHLEFTICHAHPVEPRPTAEDLLVLYLPEEAAWQHTCAAMAQAGFRRTAALNPYWEQGGQTFSDHDGYRTVIQRQQWPLNPVG